MDGTNLQAHAVDIEHDLCNEYNCDRMGIGGIANSDHIRRVGFFHGMAMVLAKYYNGDNVKKIDEFLDDNSFYAGKRMDDIGSTDVESIIKKYNELYKLLKTN